MAKDEDSGSPGWGSSLFAQTTEVATAATAVHSPRPSVIFSSKDDNGGGFQRLQNQVTKLIKGFSRSPEVKVANYNPEVLTTQKRQWAANFQLQYLDHRSWKEPTRLFESMVVVGLHPNCDIQALQRQYVSRKFEGSGKFRSALGHQNQSRVEPGFEPQVLFVYPPEKQLPLKYKDLLSFCFPGGLEVRAVERTPSMSELNEILLGQEHFKQSDLSFVFRLQGADNSTLYGCCVLVEELVQKPSGLISLISDKQPSPSSLRRHILTTQRCYCILSRLPFFELHFGVLNSIFTQERLERLTKSIGDFNLDFVEGNYEEELSEEDIFDGMPIITDSSSRNSTPENFVGHDNHREHQMANGELKILKESANDDIVAPVDPETDQATGKGEPDPPNSEYSDLYSFQGSPCEDRNFRSDVDDTETEEASISGQEDLNDLLDILEWAKENNNGPLQIISEYYRLSCPVRGSALRFHPLEHLHPLEYHRPDETVLRLAGSTFDLRSFSTGLEWAELIVSLSQAQNALLAEEEATALSIWAVACICGTLRLENVLTYFAGALLEKQIVVVCSNLGILSAAVLSIIPLIRPYQWQSLLMPVLPNDMLEFLDAPVPYIVGIKNKTNDVQSRLTNVVLIDANRNQVKSPTIPQLPRQRELFSALRPYHAKLVGESYLAKKRPVYECTEVQVEAAKGFLSILRSYLDSLCHNIRAHTITNVQSNDDKVSLLLKESFIDSFPYRDQSFMKLFVDTQLFSVHTDLVLSFFQKE
ncbi:DENN domain-containing protein 5B isoform A [Senna tora]|uniref:DENN domain-containing protein 5B isoform A n=1 Tax=Senna tora TaxID=362788 RepID=A0A835CER1_9FABA|nr:DENN domain-containing protein 5B isoform A [Senna tora]